MSTLPSSLDCSDLPGEVVALAGEIVRAGGQVYLVGGFVRDRLLGRATGDFDIATSLRPDALARLLAERAAVDQRHGSVHLRLGAAEININSMREDGPYGDRRHPDRVRFVDEVAADARRRDFTCNAIYVDPLTGRLDDPCGGVADLRARSLRVVGSADRLREDPLRMLRAVRLSARLGFDLDAGARQTIEQHAADVACLKAERVFQELTDAFTGAGRGAALRGLLELGLARYVLPEVVAMPGVEQPPEYHPEGDVFVHVCQVLDHVVPGDPVQGWAAVLHDSGKPATFERAADRIRFHGHDELSARMADAALRRLRAPKELRETVVEVCRDHIKFAGILQMRPVRRERWMRSPRFLAHLEFHRADCLGSHGQLEIHAAATALYAALPALPLPPLCTGRDVVAMGIAEGPLVGTLLRRLQAEIDAGEPADRDAAMARLRQLVEEHFRAAR